jgi:hypothetical protein
MGRTFGAFFPVVCAAPLSKEVSAVFPPPFPSLSSILTSGEFAGHGSFH